jgi:hypothetical protein
MKHPIVGRTAFWVGRLVVAWVTLNWRHTGVDGTDWLTEEYKSSYICFTRIHQNYNFAHAEKYLKHIRIVSTWSVGPYSVTWMSPNLGMWPREKSAMLCLSLKYIGRENINQLSSESLNKLIRVNKSWTVNNFHDFESKASKSFDINMKKQRNFQHRVICC